MIHSLRLLFVLGGGVGFLITGAMQWYVGQPAWLIFIYACAGCWVGFGVVYLILRLMMAMASDPPPDTSAMSMIPHSPQPPQADAPIQKP